MSLESELQRFEEILSGVTNIAALEEIFVKCPDPEIAERVCRRIGRLEGYGWEGNK